MERTMQIDDAHSIQNEEEAWHALTPEADYRFNHFSPAWRLRGSRGHHGDCRSECRAWARPGTTRGGSLSRAKTAGGA
jgi:hypothetical protein